MRTNLVRVPVFVRFVFDFIAQGFRAMEFYAFDELMLPSDPYTEKSGTYSGLVDDDSIRKRPFAALVGCPQDCSFASFGGQLYFIGGSTLSEHVRGMVLSCAARGVQFEQITRLLNKETKEYLKTREIHEIHTGTLFQFDSKRVKRLQYQSFLDSLPKDNHKGKILVGELDEASNDSLMYWETCPSLSKGRRCAHLLHLGDKLFAIGGNKDGGQTFLVEVFDQAQGAWTPLFSEKPPLINPHLLVSAAIEEDNIILIGANDSLYSLEVVDVGNQRIEGRWKTLLDKFPSQLLRSCSSQQGFTYNKRYVLWHSDRDHCIYGLDFISSKYFSVNLLKNVAGLACLSTSKLVDLGNGILCFIYNGIQSLASVDDHGQKHFLCDYHCVTFEINYNCLDEVKAMMPFPGIKLETRVVSRYKCYAPGYPDIHELYELGSAFAVDIPSPDEKKVRM